MRPHLPELRRIGVNVCDGGQMALTSSSPRPWGKRHRKLVNTTTIPIVQWIRCAGPLSGSHLHRHSTQPASPQSVCRSMSLATGFPSACNSLRITDEMISSSASPLNSSVRSHGATSKRKTHVCRWVHGLVERPANINISLATLVSRVAECEPTRRANQLFGETAVAFGDRERNSQGVQTARLHPVRDQPSMAQTCSCRAW